MSLHRANKDSDGQGETSKKCLSSTTSPSDGSTPRVLIVGAGLGGIFLAILLDRAGVSYEILERMTEIKPLDSFMGLNSNILPVYEQLGFDQELDALTLPNTSFQIMYGSMKKLATLDTRNQRDLIGYDYRICARQKLQEFLLSKVSPDKVHLNKKVLSVIQNKEGAMVRCADGTTYHGDIVVGADGAYSAVRKSLYAQLQDRDLLPSSDAKELNKGYVCLVGTTNSLDLVKFPLVMNERSDGHHIIGDGTPFSWTIFNVPDNRLCYVVVCQHTSQAQREDEKFRSSEWGPDGSTAMMKKVKNFKIPHGLTLGDLFEQTPKHKISRVYFEDKIFETWTSGRTVLIGDAAHKMPPSAGQGAICAMQDAVVLANCLYDLKSLKQESIEKAMQDYMKQRYPVVKAQTDQSNLNAMILHGQTMMEKVVRHIVLKWLPQSFKDNAVVKGASYRPQVAFLPMVAKRGTGKATQQKPSRRYQEEQLETRKEREAPAAVSQLTEKR